MGTAQMNKRADRVIEVNPKDIPITHAVLEALYTELDSCKTRADVQFLIVTRLADLAATLELQRAELLAAAKESVRTHPTRPGWALGRERLQAAIAKAEKPR